MRDWMMMLLLFGGSYARAETPDSLARRHFAQGTALYDAGDYAAAIVEFEAARAQAPLPAFTYNIGVCHERLGHLAAAIAEFERYLPTTSSPDDALELQHRIASLRERMAPPRPKDAPVSVAWAPPNGNTVLAGPRIAAIVLASLAVAAIAGGTGLYLAAREDYTELEQVCRRRICVPSDWQDASRRSDAAYALWAIGGAAATVDVILWAVDARARRGARRAWVAPAASGVVVGGTF